uniref:Ac45-VOA1_TM domain-containing protein n=1 Tax=Steinernema glaseri TaxID=37863 RepID=A0A1I8AE00_9BILA
MRLLLCFALLVVLCAGKKKKTHTTPAPTQGVPSNAESFDFPIVLPAYNKSASIQVEPVNAPVHRNYANCLLYLEGLTIVVRGQNKEFAAASIGHGSNNTTRKYQFDPSMVQCVVTSLNSTDFNHTAGIYTFKVAMNIDDRDAVVGKQQDKPKFTVSGNLAFQLVFNVSTPHYWELSKIIMEEIHVKKQNEFLDSDINIINDEASAQNMKVSSVYEYGYGCSDTQAVFFPDKQNQNNWVGLALHNFQVELFGLYRADKVIKFSRNVNDCVPTFSVGSSMGIVVALVLASVLMFGFLMLNSVQTMDRFDDPKQKQININVRE